MKRLWKKRFPSFLMALVLLFSLMPMAEARSSANVSDGTVKAGGQFTFDRREFKNAFESEYPYATFEYLELDTSSVRELYRYGSLSAFDQRGDGRDVLLTEKEAEGATYDYDEDVVNRNSQTFPLQGLSFNADSNASGRTITVSYTLYGRDGNRRQQEVYGSMDIKITGRSSGSGSHSTSGYTVKYDVNSRDRANFDYDDFRKIYDEDRSTRGSFSYLVFTGYRDLDDYGALSATDGRGREQTLNSRDLRNAKFYYDSRDAQSSAEYELSSLMFEADNADRGTLALDVELVGSDGRRDYTVEATVEITMRRGSSGGSSSKTDLVLQVEAGREVSISARELQKYFDKYSRENYSRMEITRARNLDDCGSLYSYDRRGDSYTFYEADFRDRQYYFYYDSRSMPNNRYSYTLDDLTFVADRHTDGQTVTLDFVLYGDNRDKVDGTMTVEIGDVRDNKPSGNTRGDIEYKVEPGREVVFDVRDFSRFYSDARYVTFTGSEGLNRTSGDMYYRYEYRDEEKFTASSLEDYKFYVNESSYGDYDLDNMSFVAGRNFDGVVVLEFRAWYSSRKYEDGTLVIRSTDFNGGEDVPNVLSATADIRYYITGNDTARINANDIARFYARKVPGSTLQYVILNGVPAQGALYYNFYGTSPYGSSPKELNVSNYRQQAFSYSPADRQAYALSELMYIPYGTNNCVSIPFTAYGTDGRAANGSIYISVTKKVVPEVYGQTRKGSAVPFPAAPVYSAVANATGSGLTGIRLLALPAANVGKITLGSTAMAADTTTVYGYSSGSWKMGDLRFTPAAGYTGSVEIPYAAYDASGKPYAAGKVCVGVLNGKAKTFKDMTSKTWCYKYVTELADAHIIDGYSNGTFQEKNTLTYGAALKLVMLGAGYPEQAPTVKNSPFSGYLAKAKADGLVSGNVNLKKSITRGEVSQLAAKALKLNTKNLPSVQPFTDTKDPYIQALNAAGIIEGYFSNGTSTFKPNNSLTRGHISAIVWRMIQYRK